MFPGLASHLTLDLAFDLDLPSFLDLAASEASFDLGLTSGCPYYPFVLVASDLAFLGVCCNLETFDLDPGTVHTVADPCSDYNLDLGGNCPGLDLQVQSSVHCTVAGLGKPAGQTAGLASLVFCMSLEVTSVWNPSWHYSDWLDLLTS